MGSKEFDMKNYWDMRSGNYLKKRIPRNWKEFKRYYLYPPVLKHQIKTALKKTKPESLLEVGCGPGRLLKLYSEIPEVWAVDISENMIRRAENVVSKYNLNNIKLSQMDASSLEFGDSTFELVLTSNVLLHIPYDIIERVVYEIIRVSKKYILCIEWSEDHVDKYTLTHAEKGGCFHHDYIKLFSAHRNVKIVYIKNLKFFRQRVFLFEKVS